MKQIAFTGILFKVFSLIKVKYSLSQVTNKFKKYNLDRLYSYDDFGFWFWNGYHNI